MRALVVLIGACGVAMTPAVLSAQAATEEVKGFWNRGDAANFRENVTPNSSKQINYADYPVVIDQIKERNQAAKLAPAVAPQNPLDPQQMPQNPEAQPTAPAVSTPLSREQILAKFGAPDQPQPIRAQKEAPPAMHGLFEALNTGDKELAWEYALALAKRRLEMQSAVSKATDYQMAAAEALGLRPPQNIDPSTDNIDPVRAELAPLMQKTREAELKKRVNIDAALAAEEAYVSGNSAPQAATLTSQRSDIPVDPEGKVKLLVFFDEKDRDAKQLGDSIRPLKDRYKGDPNFSVIGLTKRTYALPALKLRGAELSFPYPIVNGEALALDLRIQSYPSFVFLAVTSKQTYRLEGIPSVDEIEKTVKAMRGGR
jgi:hypothetical protein